MNSVSSYYGGGAIVATNNSTGVVSNAISVADIIRATGAPNNGPNVYTNKGGFVQNNFYVDTNRNGVIYNNNLKTYVHHIMHLQVS